MLVPVFAGFDPLAQLDRAHRMADASGQAHQNRGIEVLAQTKSGDHQVFGFLAIGWLQAGDASKLGESAVILLVLAGVHSGVVGRDDHQSGFGAGHRCVHESVGSDVEPDMLH